MLGRGVLLRDEVGRVGAQRLGRSVAHLDDLRGVRQLEAGVAPELLEPGLDQLLRADQEDPLGGDAQLSQTRWVLIGEPQRAQWFGACTLRARWERRMPWRCLD